MLTFDPVYQPYASNRYPVVANQGVVATSNPLASSAGLLMLQKGGNAVDAAIASAAVLTVTEPTSNGIGSDAFAIVWMKDKLYGFNGSGHAPMNISVEKVKALGYQEMPKHGYIPVTIPGAPKMWATLIKQFGKLSLEEILAPAIHYAENGFPLSPVTSLLWQEAFREYSVYRKLPEFQEWFRVFAPDGKAPVAGQIIKLPDHASSLRKIAETGSDAFYSGELAEKIVASSQKHGGFLSMKDLETFSVEPVQPISVNYRGIDVWELPPNGQGIVALMALNILKNYEMPDKQDLQTLHRQIEAVKLAFADARHYVTDPKEMQIDYHILLSSSYGTRCSQKITDSAVIPSFDNPSLGGTVYLATADKDGNMVSYIQSNFCGFGSGIVVENTGIALQNRGMGFSLNPQNINVLKPGKRTYHTIIPGFLTQNGTPLGPFGIMGGHVQPQAHIQVIMNLLDFRLNPQMALDAPRFFWENGLNVCLEPQFDDALLQKLSLRGHNVKRLNNRLSTGRGQMILKMPEGYYIAGTESRADGNIACY
ncbi:MAG: gamma-glutamyltransferase family protein [Lachnospiraceae bacterium]|nr:gamma-glutamyltransferase family protein [Lachnospiraceae bacterium]